jgi:hypothetical protein
MQRHLTSVEGDVDSRPNQSDASSPYGDEIDESLIERMLDQTISDRLRSLSNYVSALARFRRV